MEVCHSCRRPILKRDLVWGAVNYQRPTMHSPAEWDEVPLHRACLAQSEPERDEAYERAAAKYDGANGEKDWR